MAQVVLSNLGQHFGGPIGSFIGSIVGRMIDDRVIGSLSPARQKGPRLEALSLQSSADGAPMACVFGRARVAGQVIWAARFLEKRHERSGGKGGQRTVEYAYSLSFAVALGEGPIDGVGRVWADGQPLDLTGVTMRVHRGTQDQTPDPLIEAVEGAAPAYRGTAYVVFEDLPLGAFGNRAPQLAFEVFRRAPGEGRLEDLLEGVCLIPGAGEFCLATEAVMRREGLTKSKPENVHHAEGRADLLVSLDQLMVQAPNLKRVSLIVGWFGDDVRVGHCRIRPGVENRTKTTEPMSWKVAGLQRGEAHLISRVDDGAGAEGPAYGGTPSDASVRQAIRALKDRGLEVTLYPFVFMDCEGYPWRGRVTGHDGAGATAEVAAMFGTAEGWGLRRLALHYAKIAAEEGADGLLIGSEMRGLTWTRDAGGGFPAVAQFRTLAAECRAVVGAGVKLSYAADWSEYFGRQVGGEVRFHLDPLWADPNIDYVGIDWYPPLGDWRTGDWRDGGGGLDAVAGFKGPSSADYLAAQIAGGEGFDWYYASAADRAAQARTAIVDTAHGEDWVFRPKDLKNWWSKPHHDRMAGVRSATPTAWVPMMKPIRLTEFGCAAVDRGGNAPNLFQDPKSTENALPPFSTGARDDRMQRRALEAVLKHYGAPANNPVSPVYGGRMLEGADAWCWDARPYPAFPARAEVWADAAAWRAGHWLNGRLGGEAVDMIAAVLRRGGLGEDDFVVGALEGEAAGYVIDRPMRTRDALEPLLAAFGATAAERDGRVAVQGEEAAVLTLRLEAMSLPDVGASVAADRALEARPDTARVRFIDETADYQTGSVVARAEQGGDGGGLDADLLVVCDAELATSVAHRALSSGVSERLTVRLGPLEALKLEPGDGVEVEGRAGEWRLARLDWDEQPTATLEPVVRIAPGEARPDWRPGEPPRVMGAPFLRLLDLPPLPGAEDDGRPVAVVAAEPWRPMTVHGGQDAATLTPRAAVMQPATVGVLTGPLRRGVVGRWDEANAITVRIEGAAPQSLSGAAVLGGGNALAVETAAGWEVVQYRRADLIGGEVWRLTGLLRGQQGTEAEAAAGAAAGALVVMLDRDLPRVEMSAGERGLQRLWRAGPTGAPPGGAGFAEAGFTWAGRSARPWRPAHLGAVAEGGGWRLSWTPRVRVNGEGWETEPVEVDPRRFRVRVLDGGVEKRVWEVQGLEAIYAATQVATDWPGEVGEGARFAVAQWGEGYGWGTEAFAPLL
ncbi:glycoside hydrolase/phage tail family protein [uncultured Brevundimonas sp.]|uniref:baseplate multidomain protein megatron n=1 Tax=uncultured Brevundimonas sp. TaxID=213418 RepID=UPI0025D7CBE3|nr:glycoside hydrolase/phage tail family protein [uncultured Brevundimonas sp.]